jgi:uncharacterized protein (TIGR02246 family)
MIARILSVALLAVGIASPAVAQGTSAAPHAAPQKTRAEIESFMQRWVDAYNHGDATTFARLIAPDSFGVGDRGVISGTRRIERVEENEAKLGGKVASMRVEEVRLLGRNAAVAAGPYAVTYSNPRPLTIQGTWMQVLERRHGVWQSIAASYTPMTAPPPPAAGASNPQPYSGSSTK